ncbi:MAG TPA: GNAT family N-acetyltransferase [Rubellimicrobium sp.]|nr:GNAT family N-acetyltransferase [Rubellimicrobium sp.]
MIRRLTLADLATWRAFRVEALTQSPESFLMTLAEEEARPDEALVADVEDRPVLGRFEGDRLTGCIALRGMEGPDFAHRAWVGTVYVAPERRGTGDADRLMEAIVAVAREEAHLQLELYVLSTNARAVRFYERHGFRVTGKLPRAVYRNGLFEDDLHLVRMLD